MIKKLPSKLVLPNYTFDFCFVPVLERENPEDEADLTEEKWFGEISIIDCSVKIKDTNKNFNDYLYCLFLTSVILLMYDSDLSDVEMIVLGNFVFHILHHNDFMQIDRKLKRAGAVKDSFSIDVPSFKLSVQFHETENSPLGYLYVSEQKISIHKRASTNLRFVVLIHELVEWAKAFYRLERLSHSSLSNFAEAFAFVIRENKFTT